MTEVQIRETDLDRIKDVLGVSGWKAANDADSYFEDPRGRFTGSGRLVALPQSTAQVAEVVRICNEAKIPVIPYSGGTGVVAGQLSIDSGAVIVLSLERMNRVREFSPDDSVLIAEAGCILENIHAVAREHGMMFPLSMASKGSCRIGGNLATNAGGIQVVRYGNARNLCLGIEAVFPDGSIYSELSPLRKNNTGYDLRHLLIGSEGTLGVITAATLALTPIDQETATVMCAVEAPAEAVRLLHALRRNMGDSLTAIELMSGLGLTLVTRHFPDLKSPFQDSYEWYLLCEFGGPEGVCDQLELCLSEKFEDGGLLDAVIAKSENQRQALWNLRELTAEANKLAGAICSSDTSVPISRIDEFIAATTQAVREIDASLRINSYGHVGDGNIHHNVFPPEGISKRDYIESNAGVIERVRMAINRVTLGCNGSISAEHGIGRLKANDIELCASPAKMNLMRRIKAAIDPNQIMNPGALLREQEV